MSELRFLARDIGRCWNDHPPSRVSACDLLRQDEGRAPRFANVRPWMRVYVKLLLLPAAIVLGIVQIVSWRYKIWVFSHES